MSMPSADLDALRIWLGVIERSRELYDATPWWRIRARVRAFMRWGLAIEEAQALVPSDATPDPEPEPALMPGRSPLRVFDGDGT
jgi:hypothetical protein